MKRLLRFFLFGFCSLFVFCHLSFGICCNYALSIKTDKQQLWPARYSATFGFELMADHNGVIIVSSVDTTLQAYKLGVRPGMELLAWNTLPLARKMESMKIRKYRKEYPVMTDLKIKLMLLTRGRPGETAEVFFLTSTGNYRGIRLTATESSPGPVASAR
jgi:hypothetical protein